MLSKRGLIYTIPGASWSLEFPDEALTILHSHAQVVLHSKETVGQLYAKDLARVRVTVEIVTQLEPKSSYRSGVKLDIPAVNREREIMFSRGFHCLGFWHSHPEPIPRPSSADRILAESHARVSKEEFSALLFVIVGTRSFPNGLGVWFHDGTTFLQAHSRLNHFI
ncbi:Mov34/MPN/PAD-1 family protein [Advenella kashmirensis]